MPRWSLIVAAIGALVLVALATHLVPADYVTIARGAAAVAFALAALIAAQQKNAIWCGLFVGLAIIFQPAFPLDMKGCERYAEIGAAVLTAVCVVREW